MTATDHHADPPSRRVLGVMRCADNWDPFTLRFVAGKVTPGSQPLNPVPLAPLRSPGLRTAAVLVAGPVSLGFQTRERQDAPPPTLRV